MKRQNLAIITFSKKKKSLDSTASFIYFIYLFEVFSEIKFHILTFLQIE